ncbi:tenascin-like [Tenebrio molitor]|uniref:tenascin-like n=1 Tax=Tenebrio molitor TaxID=7067 RepID=UPI00362477AE
MELPSVTLAVVLLLGSAIAANIQQCNDNEEFTSCGTACPPTCQNKNPRVCTDNCIIGCVCKKGYIREGPNGRCVPESCENVPICSENEKFSTCATACPKTCNETEPRICPLVCIKGCTCRDGFVREKLSGRCIPEVSCQNTCGENEIYKECGTLCPGTCAQPVRTCERKCLRGCFCKDGYLLDDQTGKCIKRDNCPTNCDIPICTSNEVYEECGTLCPETCNDKGVPKICPDVCVEGCFCKEGFVRKSENGQCVPVAACENVPKCTENEEFTECGSLCPLTCDNNVPRLCPEVCLETCVCKKGYVRSTLGGPCVPQDSCYQVICKANEIYKTCGSPCPGTCSQPTRVCERRCVAGCFCQDGYVLDDKTHECILADSCPVV